MTKPLPPIRCSFGNCRQPATWSVEAKGPTGWTDTGACTKHRERMATRAERDTGGKPHVTPWHQPGVPAPDQQLTLDI